MYLSFLKKPFSVFLSMLLTVHYGTPLVIRYYFCLPVLRGVIPRHWSVDVVFVYQYYLLEVIPYHWSSDNLLQKLRIGEGFFTLRHFYFALLPAFIKAFLAADSSTLKTAGLHAAF